jgi:hypothetical protein
MSTKAALYDYLQAVGREGFTAANADTPRSID